MTDDQISSEVNLEEVSKVVPAGSDEEVVTPLTDSSAVKESKEEKPIPEKKGETIVRREPLSPEVSIKEVAGETPREYALRLENKRLRDDARRKRTDELMVNSRDSAQNQPVIQKNISPDAVLSKYNPEEIKNLEEIFPVLAAKLGFARKEELQASSYEQVKSDEFTRWQDAHPEYLPENDHDDVLWNQFKEEYRMYKEPANPRDYKKIFDRVHDSITGGTSKNNVLARVAAKQEKLKTASHSGGAPATTAPRASSSNSKLSPEQRSALHGFKEEELQELGLI